MHRYSLLDPAQKASIARFLADLPKLVELDFEGRKVVSRALRNYWGDYLPTSAGQSVLIDWPTGRPFQGHGDRRFPKIFPKPPARDAAAGKNPHRPDRMGASLLKNLCVDFKRTNLILDLSFLLIPYDSQIKLRLKIKPKIGSRSERISKPKSHLGRDTALLLNDIVDAWSRNVQSQCQFISVQV